MIKLNEDPIAAEKHFQKVFPLIKQRINNIFLKGIRRTKAPVTISLKFKNFLKELKKEKTLRPIVLAKPDEFRGLIASLNRDYPGIFTKKHNENHIIRNIFISHCYEKICKLEFITGINKDTCLYCNRNYIYSLKKSGSIKPPIDHFYPKGLYPIFGVSFYNLIPSCEICNGFGAKGEKDPVKEDLISPYELKGQEFLFSYKIDNIEFINPLSDIKGISLEMPKKLDGNDSVFKLKELYEKHSDHVLELILKSKIQYSQQYRDYLKSYDQFIFNDNEIDRMILGNYTNQEDIHKRPLAKLYQDIGKELGLI